MTRPSVAFAATPPQAIQAVGDAIRGAKMQAVFANARFIGENMPDS